MYDSLVPLMSTEERDKQNTWVDTKMLVEKGFISEVEQWLVNTDDNDDDVIEKVHAVVKTVIKVVKLHPLPTLKQWQKKLYYLFVPPL